MGGRGFWSIQREAGGQAFVHTILGLNQVNSGRALHSKMTRQVAEDEELGNLETVRQWPSSRVLGLRCFEKHLRRSQKLCKQCMQNETGLRTEARVSLSDFSMHPRGTGVKRWFFCWRFSTASHFDRENEPMLNLLFKELSYMLVAASMMTDSFQLQFTCLNFVGLPNHTSRYCPTILRR